MFSLSLVQKAKATSDLCSSSPEDQAFLRLCYAIFFPFFLKNHGAIVSCCKYGRQCANTSNVCARHSAILAFAGSRSAIQGRTAARGTIILLSRERLFSWSCCVGRRVHSLRRPVAGGCCVQHGGAGHVMGPFRHAARFRRCSGRTHSSIDRSVGPVRCVQERHCPRGEHRLRAPGRAPACSLGFAWQQQPPLWPPALVPLRERR